MAHDRKEEKIVYIGDSRIRKRTEELVQEDYSAYPGKSEVFIPNFLLKEWMVAVVALVGVLTLVMYEPAPLGLPADPLNGSFIPMPDWYFLFLYQLLKYPYTSEDYMIFGLVVPGLLFGALLLAPFLDKGRERRFYKRPITSALMFLSLTAVTYMTVFSWMHYTSELEKNDVIPEHIVRAEQYKQARAEGKEWPLPELPDMVAADDPGAAIYEKASCVACHAADLSGTAGPALLGVGDKFTAEEITQIIVDGIGTMPPQMDALKASLSDEEIDQLVNWLAMQKRE